MVSTRQLMCHATGDLPLVRVSGFQGYMAFSLLAVRLGRSFKLLPPNGNRNILIWSSWVEMENMNQAQAIKNKTGLSAQTTSHTQITGLRSAA